MSYSFGTVVESTDYDDVCDSLRDKFKEVYPNPEKAVEEAVHRVTTEIPYVLQEFLPSDVPDGHTVNITLSGHEHVTDGDAAPRYVSLTLTLNKKPEPVEAEEPADNADEEAEEPAAKEHAVAGGVGSKAAKG